MPREHSLDAWLNPDKRREICEAAAILRDLNMDCCARVSASGCGCGTGTCVGSTPSKSAVSRGSYAAIPLVVHTSACVDQTCGVAGCARLKGLLEHAYWCSRVITSCTPCRRVWALLKVHSATCGAPGCPVLTCRLRMFS